MNHFEFTLLTDGSSDAVLIHPLTWLLGQHLRDKTEAINGTWADLRRLRTPPVGLSARIAAALDLYPCDVLFVHRDAEGETCDFRVQEIAIAADGTTNPLVPVVPVRMQEAWLLIDKVALRRAAGNPNGQINLNMPPIRQLEQVLNPKQVLHELLLNASELTGRMRKKQNPAQQSLRLGEIIEDYSPLRRLPAFQHTEECLLRILRDRFDLNT